MVRLDLVIEGSAGMKPVNIYDAKTRFSELIEKAAAGDDVVVSRNGRPVARITRLEAGENKEHRDSRLKFQHTTQGERT